MSFTVQPFCGNPAAVVFDCDDMNSDWMQAASREMNLSETVFFLRPATPDADYRARFLRHATNFHLPVIQLLSPLALLSR